MAVHDTIGDFLTIIRNGSAARRDKVSARHSKVHESLCQIFKDEGYIKDFTVQEDGAKRVLEIDLKYVDDVPAITGLERHSTPGRRVYYGYRDIPRILGGLGIAILTTSKGVMRAREARRQRLGGELICAIW